jgi:uncharacterized Fe-S radical SAM superfamily protein PflX
MLSHLIAIQATTSITAIMNMASLISTTTKEFTENIGNVVTASPQQQQQAILTRVREARNR